jgi:hypothetical protein
MVFGHWDFIVIKALSAQSYHYTRQAIHQQYVTKLESTFHLLSN